MMVLVHIAEAFHLFPGMNWGRNNSVGHYLDLFSAILGLIATTGQQAIMEGSVRWPHFWSVPVRS
jgi:hypothetical protein